MNLIDQMKRVDASRYMESLFEYDKWRKEIPFIKFDPEWEVKIIPPFGNAVVRFLIKKGDKQVSVYLDCYAMLGAEYQPYWEAYPCDGDTFRCDMTATDELLMAIREELK